MGSKSNNGWWKSLFRRSDRTQAETRNEQLGSNQFQPFSGQASSPVVIEFYDEEIDEVLEVILICSCGLPVISLTNEYEGFFYCQHCDYECWGNKNTCQRCIKYNRFVDERY
jgi:hypothetical protein